MADDEDLITVALIARPQGLRGEVIAELRTDFPDRFEDLDRVLLRLASGRLVERQLEYGAEIGIGPMMALAKVDIVKGRPAPKAELARALALAAGHEIRVEESTNTRVTVSGRRAGSDFWQKVTWTMDDVKKAGIVNPAYSRYPRQMLLARASAELVRTMCPDVLGGIGQFAEEVDGDGGPVAAAVAVAPASAPAPASNRRQRKPLGELPPAELPPLPGDDPPPLPKDALPLEVVENITDVQGITDAQMRKLMACMNENGIVERGQRLAFTSAVIGRDVGSAKELTKAEAAKVIDRLEEAFQPAEAGS